MVYILGQGNVARLGFGRVWAERGLVHWEDEIGGYKIMSVYDALTRLKALSDARPKIQGTEDKLQRAWIKTERDRFQRFVEEVLPVIRQAQEQGMPEDLSARASIEASRPKTVGVPQLQYKIPRGTPLAKARIRRAY